MVDCTQLSAVPDFTAASRPRTQANLGLRRGLQCEQCLALASMLALKEPVHTTNIMRSQLSRLYGQLYAFQVRAVLGSAPPLGVCSCRSLQQVLHLPASSSSAIMMSHNKRATHSSSQLMIIGSSSHGCRRLASMQLSSPA